MSHRACFSLPGTHCAQFLLLPDRGRTASSRRQHRSPISIQGSECANAGQTPILLTHKTPRPGCQPRLPPLPQSNSSPFPQLYSPLALCSLQALPNKVPVPSSEYRETVGEIGRERAGARVLCWREGGGVKEARSLRPLLRVAYPSPEDLRMPKDGSSPPKGTSR